MNKWGGLESHLVVLPHHVIVPRKETGTNYVFSLPDPIAMFTPKQYWFLAFAYALPLKIQLSSEEGCDPINLFNTATFLWLSHGRTWLSNVI